VTFHNADTGFAVIRVKARGRRDLVTVVGHAATIGAGEFVTASGTWITDRTHGLQFKAQVMKATPPTGAAGIEKYLASGQMRGIGPAMADRRPVRRLHLRHHRGRARSAEGSRRDRTEAGRTHRGGLGRAESRSGDHDLPARARRRHSAGGPHLQDLWA
jgi:hypothetical protein